MKSKWRIVGLGLFAALVSVVGLPGAVKGQSKEIIDGARKEGKVLLYTALTIHEIDEIAGPFGKKYPFVKVEPFRGNALQLLQKIAMEARAGRAQVDVAQFNGFEAWQLQKLGLLELQVSRSEKLSRCLQGSGRILDDTLCQLPGARIQSEDSARRRCSKKMGGPYSPNGKETNWRSTETTRFGTAAWTCIGEKKKPTSSCELWLNSNQPCAKGIR